MLSSGACPLARCRDYRDRVLRVRLLGELAVELDGAALTPPSSRRAWALLAWLALHPGLHRRGVVAARFWPDVLDSSARGSLRSAIWALRRALGSAGEAYLFADHERVGLDPVTDVWVDVAEFDELLGAGRLEDAVALGSSGELLAGFDDDWVLEAREEYQAKLGEVLERLAVAAQDRGDAGAAVAWTRRQVSLDALAEEPMRRLMTRLAAAGTGPPRWRRTTVSGSGWSVSCGLCRPSRPAGWPHSCGRAGFRMRGGRFRGTNPRFRWWAATPT
jgi:DNA-binding SARP family transcriptional activator